MNSSDQMLLVSPPLTIEDSRSPPQLIVGGSNDDRGAADGDNADGSSLRGDNDDGNIDDDSHLQIDQNFCKDFTCCGEKLKTMHDLLEHYETVHVVVREAVVNQQDQQALNGKSCSDIVAAGALKSLSQQSASASATNSNSVMTSSSSSSSSSSGSSEEESGDEQQSNPFGTPLMPPLTSSGGRWRYNSHHQDMPNNTNSAYGMTIFTPQSVSLDSAMPAGYEVPNGVHVFDEPNVMTVAPSMLSGPSDDENFDNTASTILKHHLPQMYQQQSGSPQSGMQMALDPTQSYIEEAYQSYIGQLKVKHSSKRAERKALRGHAETVPKKFDCLVPGCDKVYRNQNGLKYHIMHSHTQKERQLVEMLQKAIKEDPAEKPYACHVEGCDKRYRNTNGLKYHLINGHPDLGNLHYMMPRIKQELAFQQQHEQSFNP
ncbi:hypothetical protein MIR68_011231 [Amoeboaphelidium protococcarum]|nr:hypothetical protein MIR68_011231 [Amoeboaphelidium protococcarum]